MIGNDHHTVSVGDFFFSQFHTPHQFALFGVEAKFRNVRIVINDIAAAFPQGNYDVVSSRAARGSGETRVAVARQLLREIYPRREEAVRPKEKISLFNGHDLTGW